MGDIQPVNFKDGGIAVVMVGNNGAIVEFKHHPRVTFLDCKTIPNGELEGRVPSNTKAIIITDGLPQYHQLWAHSYCRKQNIPYLVRKTNGAIYEQLKNWFHTEDEVKPTTVEIKEEVKRGRLEALIPFIDFRKSNAENARDLMRKASELGIKSTPGSLAQYVSNQRKKQGRGEIPKSLRSQLDVSVELLDKMVEDLNSMRDYLINTTEENRLLKSKLEKFRKAFEE